MLAHLQRTRADGLETVQKRVVRRERGLQLGRIAHFGDLDALDGQRLVRRPERQAAPRACAPPRRREARVHAPVAAEDVPERTRDVESLAGGAVALVALRVRQAFRPVPADLRPLAARDAQVRIGAVVGTEMPEHRRFRLRRHDAAGTQYVRAPPHLTRRLPIVRQVPQRRREEQPARRDQAAEIGDRPPHDGCVGPRRRLFVKKRRARHRALRPDAERLRIALVRHARVPQFRHAPDGPPGRQFGIVRGFRLQDEAAAHGDLRKRRVFANLPDDRLQAMNALRQARHPVGLVMPPVLQATLRPTREFSPVQQQDEPLVRTDVKRERRVRRDRKVAPKPQERLRHLRQGRRIRPRFRKSCASPHVKPRHPHPRSGIDGLHGTHVRVAPLVPFGTKDARDLVCRRNAGACPHRLGGLSPRNAGVCPQENGRQNYKKRSDFHLKSSNFHSSCHLIAGLSPEKSIGSQT